MTATLALAREPGVSVDTLRFGALWIPLEQLYDFPHGLPGFDDLRRFAWLPVGAHLGWLQSIDVPALAFLLVAARKVAAEGWTATPDAWAVVTLGDTPDQCTANLRAPVLLDPATRTGSQRIAEDSRWSTTEPVDLAACAPPPHAGPPTQE